LLSVGNRTDHEQRAPVILPPWPNFQSTTPNIGASAEEVRTVANELTDPD
jgi:hypothetical protein